MNNSVASWLLALALASVVFALIGLDVYQAALSQGWIVAHHAGWFLFTP